MKRLMIVAAALLATACTPPAPQGATPHEGVTLPMADAAGNRMEALSEQSGRWCSSDGAWCVVKNAADVQIVHGEVSTQVLVFDPETNPPEVWPVIVRNGRDDDSVLVGLSWPSNEMYSGGGANASHVTLYRFEPGAQDAPAVLRFPSGASISIRACFDEDDRVARRDACSDEYIFGGDVALDETNTSGPARLILQTTATTFPGVRSRDSDSTQEPPLQESDLVAAPDADCSYRRVLTFNGEGYDYDTPPPDCDDYWLQSERIGGE